MRIDEDDVVADEALARSAGRRARHVSTSTHDRAGHRKIDAHHSVACIRTPSRSRLRTGPAQPAHIVISRRRAGGAASSGAARRSQTADPILALARHAGGDAIAVRRTGWDRRGRAARKALRSVGRSAGRGSARSERLPRSGEDEGRQQMRRRQPEDSARFPRDAEDNAGTAATVKPRKRPAGPKSGGPSFAYAVGISRRRGPPSAASSSRATMLVILIIGFTAGPAVSL